MKSIQLSNLESSRKRMIEARERNNEEAFNNAKEELAVTLNCIENCDRETYNEFSQYLNEELNL